MRPTVAFFTIPPQEAKRRKCKIISDGKREEKGERTKDGWTERATKMKVETHCMGKSRQAHFQVYYLCISLFLCIFQTFMSLPHWRDRRLLRVPETAVPREWR